jgi:hypothetical protein
MSASTFDAGKYTDGFPGTTGIVELPSYAAIHDTRV